MNPTRDPTKDAAHGRLPVMRKVRADGVLLIWQAETNLPLAQG
jgi:hypothetical protein